MSEVNRNEITYGPAPVGPAEKICRTTMLSLTCLYAAFVVLVISGNQALLMSRFAFQVEASPLQPCPDSPPRLLCSNFDEPPSAADDEDGDRRAQFARPFANAGLARGQPMRPVADKRLWVEFSPWHHSGDGVDYLSGGARSEGRNININVLSNIPFVDIIRASRGEWLKSDSSQVRVTPPAWRPNPALRWALNQIPAVRAINLIRRG